MNNCLSCSVFSILLAVVAVPTHASQVETIKSSSIVRQGERPADKRSLKIPSKAVPAVVVSASQSEQVNSPVSKAAMLKTTAPSSSLALLTPTATFLATPPGTLYMKEALSIVASVHAPLGTPSGVIYFTDGPSVLGTASLNSSGFASIITANLSVGTHHIVANYGGNTHMAPSVSGTGTVVVHPLPPPPSISCTPTQLSIPQGTTDGIVAAASSSSGRSFSIGFQTSAGTLTTAGTVATLNTTALHPGVVTVTCSVRDDLGQTNAASAQITVQASQTVSTVSLTATPTTTVTGQTITLTAFPTAGSLVPQGSVRFSDGTATLGITTLSSGAASLAVSLAQGTHPITATYLGSTTIAGSTSSAVSVTVQPPPPTITCVATPAVLYQGQTATIAANAVSAANLPLTVAFSTSRGALQISGTTANFTTTGAVPGVTGVSCSATDQLGRTATTVANVTLLAKIDTTASMLSLTSPVMVGSPVTIAAAIAAASGPVSGSVTFLDGSAPLGTVALNGAGQAQFMTSTLRPGNHVLSASFAGSDTLNASQSAGSTLVIAAPAAPLISCAASPSSINVGDTAQITANASSSPGRTITVAFSSSTGSLNGTANTATWQSTGSPTGQAAAITCTATDDLGQATTANTSVWINGNAGEAAHTAFSFTDSVGVNVHLHFGGTPYVDSFNGVMASMVALGIHHYRSGIDPYAQPFEYANAEALAAAGIKADWLIDGNDTPANINAIYANAPHSIEAFEGPNEDNVQAGPYLTNFMQMLHDTVRGNPNTANVPIINFTLTDANLINQQGDFSQNVNYANMHDYYYPRQPETPSYGGNFWNCGGYGSMSFNLCVSEVNAQNRPTISTETGYISGTQSDTVLGKYIVRTLLKHTAMNISRTYVYEMAENIYSPGYGLIKADLTPKPAYTAIQSLMQFFQDQSFTTAGKLDYILSGQTANLEHVLLQKKDGTFVLALWLGVASANPVFPYETYTITPQNVAITVNTPVGASSISLIADDGTLTTQPSPSGSSFTLPVTDSITLLSFSPGTI